MPKNLWIVQLHVMDRDEDQFYFESYAGAKAAARELVSDFQNHLCPEPENLIRALAQIELWAEGVVTDNYLESSETNETWLTIVSAHLHP